MSKIMTWCIGVALASALAGCGQSSAAVRAAGGSPGRVIEVPGLSALNTGKGGGTGVSSLSCGSAGNCVAGGFYWARHRQLGFVAVERNGRWGKATPVPGLAALNGPGPGSAGVVSVSCSSASSCAAGGYYADSDLHDNDGFVVSEKNGEWVKAVTFPTDIFGEIDSLSCASAGNCVAGGTADADYFSSFHGFVAQERNGRWQKEIAVPGLAALNKGGSADVGSLSCASAGNCAAAGYYSDKQGNSQGFVAAERNSAWGNATGVPGLAALNTGENAQVNSVSCASPGNCVAGGFYWGRHRQLGFVAVERNGRWGKAIPVPGLAALNKVGRNTTVLTVSCAPAGTCEAGGYYSDHSGHRQGFTVTENNGRWGRPSPLPGLTTLNKGGNAQVSSLSCRSPGSCAAGGTYTNRSGRHQGFVTQGR